MPDPTTDAPFPDSLCHRCRHLRIVRSARSTFLMCQEPTLPKYTAQPVRACRGFAPPDGGGAPVR
jgi:hypothetical protein